MPSNFVTKACGVCSRAFTREDGFMVCGAGVNDARLAGENIGAPNPIWAVRKYSEAGIMLMFAEGGREDLDGFDCSHMHPMDGRQCDLFKRASDLTPSVVEREAAHLGMKILIVAQWITETMERLHADSWRAERMEGVKIEINVELSRPRHGGGRDRLPMPERVAVVESAAELIAPDWEVEITATFGGDVFVLPGRYAPAPRDSDAVDAIAHAFDDWLNAR